MTGTLNLSPEVMYTQFINNSCLSLCLV